MGPFLTVIILVAGSVSLIHSAFYFPSFDDWHYASMGLESGSLWRPVVQEYFSWNGRYTSAFVLTNSPLTWPHFAAMRAWMIASFVGFWLALAYLGSVISKRSPQDKSSLGRDLLGGSLLLAVLLTFFQEYSAESYFWFAGNVNYYVPWVFHCLHLALLVRAYRNPRAAGACTHLGLALLSVLSCGFNEASMLLTTGLNFFYLLALWPKVSRRSRVYAALVFVLSLLCVALVVLSPGNAARATHSEHSGQLVHTLVQSFISPPGLVLRLVVQFPVLFLFPALFWKQWTRIFPKGLSHTGMRSRILAVAAFWLSLSALVAPSFWGHGGIPNHRTHYYLALPVFLGLYALVPHRFWAWLSRGAPLLVVLSLVGAYMKTPLKQYIQRPGEILASAQGRAAEWERLEELMDQGATAPSPSGAATPEHEHFARYLRALNNKRGRP